jgi:hypothetical protein
VRAHRYSASVRGVGRPCDHLEGILNYWRAKVSLRVIEAVNVNIEGLLRRGGGYRDINYLLLKAQRVVATKTEFIALQKAA